ncbi:MAG: 5'-nucleotidase [Desulfurococcales archaeon ex4484_204]|nr:MAG: 5'-nucleotidase [Desulfurococcales archaeon ex4484_204]
MPVEVRDRERFIEISAKAEECRIVRNEKKEVAKVKARTRRYLYTIKVPVNELNSFLKQLRCKKIVEILKGGERKEITF